MSKPFAYPLGMIDGPQPSPIPKTAEVKKAFEDLQIPPEGYVHPLEAYSMDVVRDWIKKRVAKETFGDDDNLLNITVTGYRYNDPGTFSVRLKEYGGEVSRIEGVMKFFYSAQRHKQPNVSKEEVILNGIYAGWDSNYNVWRRVQVVRVDGEQKHLIVFLIDHGRFLDLECGELRYLTSYHTSVMRHAYFASFAYLPNEPRMLLAAARYFMHLSVDKEWLTYFHKVDMREDGPRLLLRFGMDLAMEGIGDTKLIPGGIVY